MYVELIPLRGVSYPLFYRPRGSRGFTDGRKRKNLRWRPPFEGAELSFSLEPVPLSGQTMPEIAHLLTLIGPCPGLASASGYVPSPPADGAGCQDAEP